MDKIALVIGAGPAGLTAAHELVEKTDIKPIVFEKNDIIGGISQTVNYKGNRIDIGGHRFFSKSDRVMNYWLSIFGQQGSPSRDDIELHREIPLSDKPNAPDPEKTDKVMIVRNRVSRIFFMRRFFDYPLSLNIKTIKNLGLLRMCKMGFSYIKVLMFPIREEKNLEDFLINRFGKELYLTFFKDYTKKVWGVSCDKIPSEWGAQRIKGLSIKKAISHALKKMFIMDSSIGQKKTETSLIEQFLYPKLGPGQLWEEVAEKVKEKGGQILMNHQVVSMKSDGSNITELSVRDKKNGEISTYNCDYVFSSMPVKELIAGLENNVPAEVSEVAEGLVYRDFVTVGLLLKEMKVKNETKIRTINNIIPDNWIYIQEKNVKLGRLQIFNNWSPYMVSDKNNIWIGMEYFCTEGDDLWSKPDEDFKKFAIEELAKIDIIDKEDVLDSVVIRIEKAYPAYFGSYDRFDIIKNYVNNIENLFLIGRNGQHRYNNQDHSMLTAMLSVENIISGIKGKENIWAVNTEGDYHEEKN